MNENALAVRTFTELTPEEERELAQFLESDPELLRTTVAEVIKDEDLARPPYIKVSSRSLPVDIPNPIAPDGPSEVPPGHIVVMPDVVIHGPSFEVVVVAKTHDTFGWLPPYEDGGNPYCLSDPTGMFPLKPGSGIALDNPQSGPCRVIEDGFPVIACPRAKWGELDDETGQNAPPECSRAMGYVLWLIDVEGDESAVFRVRKTAIRYGGKPLNSLIKKIGITHTVFMTTTLIKREVNGNKQSWYVPIFTKGRKLKREELYQAVLIKKQWDEFLPDAAYNVDDYGNTNGYTPDPDAQVIEHDAGTPPPTEADTDEIPF